MSTVLADLSVSKPAGRGGQRPGPASTTAKPHVAAEIPPAPGRRCRPLAPGVVGQRARLSCDDCRSSALLTPLPGVPARWTPLVAPSTGHWGVVRCGPQPSSRCARQKKRKCSPVGSVREGVLARALNQEQHSLEFQCALQTSRALGRRAATATGTGSPRSSTQLALRQNSVGIPFGRIIDLPPDPPWPPWRCSCSSSG